MAGEDPAAVVVFLGANEGFPIDGADCCGADWAAAYATRARTMMDAWRRKGAARVYWLTLPLPRDEARQEIARLEQVRRELGLLIEAQGPMDLPPEVAQAVDPSTSAADLKLLTVMSRILEPDQLADLVEQLAVPPPSSRKESTG